MLPKGMCALRAHCNEKDHHLLLNFKHTVTDPSHILSSWSHEQHCCEWVGVQCDNTTGRVTELSLPCSPELSANTCEYDKENCLAGELHLSLLQLEFLNYLDLSNHDFQAVILNDCPHSCENINSSNLLYLDLSYNEDLHFDNLHWLSIFPSLEHVNLRGINLQGKVDWIQLPTLLPSIKELRFDSCQLRNINPFLQYVNLTSLEFIGLSDNSFSSLLPVWLFNLSDVTFIDLSYNNFQDQFPKGLLNLRKLQALHLKHNKLIGPIPDWLGQLEHLQEVDVSENLFSGPIPSTLGNLTSLTHLHVSSNHLAGSLPESLGQLLNLGVLEFDDNHLTGHVCERNFANLSKLTVLSMGSPGLIFEFDSLWIPPFQLEQVGLSYMVGPNLPTWLYTQTSLALLQITYSSFSLKSQDKFWDLVAQVPRLYLTYNTIVADISNVLLNSTDVRLYSNQIRGTLPRLSPNVVWFNAKNNSFHGSLSPLLCQKMSGRCQLIYLVLSDNFLSGELTDCWTNWKSLAIISLSNNNLAGTIPRSLIFLSNLTVLHLNKNNLLGELPLSLKNCQNLQDLDVGENKLSGYIPYWIGHNARVLRLRSNQFSGIIPPQICQLTSLIVLDFAENNIFGSIPPCLHNMKAMAFPRSSELSSICITSQGFVYKIIDSAMLHIKGQEWFYEGNLRLMRSIDLSGNNLSGMIPPNIYSLFELLSLNLSHNRFEGNIPIEIGNLKQLESLDLANNQLSGEIPQSITQLSFLEVLDLSFNNFSGKIPLGTQLQGFDPQSYIGNPELCGVPLPKNCAADQKDIKPIEQNENQEDEFLPSFYMGLGVGFAIAFWGVCGAIFFNRNFRCSYFRFLYHVRDKLYVLMVLKVNRFR
ncbi:receptor-like protein EIX2 [Prosopis cineraria]|uniref:receptor-like protein EIX2 n=1 Tax=Prosopis cineraria TaxID=364024 RepID=UPI00240FE6EA|nr:receptor-like protein EIX2 [Prosopis cineraria]